MQHIVDDLVKNGVITAPSSAKGKLLQAAAKLFREKGYEKTTTRDLATEIGILSGSIFHHFKNKEAILYEVMRQTILLNTERLNYALTNADNPEQRLLELIKQELQFINGDTGEAMAVLVFEWRSLSIEKQKEILVLRDIYEKIWLDVIQDNIDAGLIHTKAFIFRRFLTGTVSWTVNWYKQDKSMDIAMLAEQILNTYIQPRT